MTNTHNANQNTSFSIDTLYQRIEEAETLGNENLNLNQTAQERLSKLFSDPAPEVRQQALYSLNQSNYNLELCLKALKDRDYLVRASAAEILGNVKTPQSSEALIELLKDPYYVVRATAAEALGQQEAFLAVPALQDTLLDPDQWVRYSAAESLNQIEPDSPLWEYIMALNSTQNEGYLQALKNIAHINDARAIPTLLHLFKQHIALQEEILQALVSMKDHLVIPALIDIAVFTDLPHIRESALLAAQSLSVATTLEALNNWLDPDHVQFAQRAIELIAQFPTDAAKPLLLKALDMPDQWIRTVALLTLEKQNVAVDLKHLSLLIKTPSEDLATAALLNLAKHHTNTLHRYTQSFLTSEKSWRRVALSACLLHANDHDRLALASVLAKDTDATVRESTLKHLKPHAKSFAALMLEGLEDEEHWVRQQAVESLAHCNLPKITQKLCHHLLNDPDFMVRAAAAQALDTHEHYKEEIKKALWQATKDKSGSVQLQATRSLLRHNLNGVDIVKLINSENKAVRLTLLQYIQQHRHLLKNPELEQCVSLLSESNDVQLSSAASQLNH